MGRALLVLTTDADKDKAIHWIRKAPDGTRVEFKASKRTLPQNDRMWAMLTDVAAHEMKVRGLDYTTDEWKLIFLHAFGREVRFLPALDGRGVVPILQSSSDLSKDEMTDFIEFLFSEGAKRGVVFHEPHETSSDLPASDEHGSGDPAPDAAAGQSSSQENDGEEAGGDNAPVSEPADRVGLVDQDRTWLKDTARMLWAATGRGEQELLKNTFDGIREHHTPETIGKAARDKGNSIYKQCKLVCFGEADIADTLELIAGIAGVEPKELVG